MNREISLRLMAASRRRRQRTAQRHAQLEWRRENSHVQTRLIMR